MSVGSLGAVLLLTQHKHNIICTTLNLIELFTFYTTPHPHILPSPPERPQVAPEQAAARPLARRERKRHRRAVPQNDGRDGAALARGKQGRHALEFVTAAGARRDVAKAAQLVALQGCFV
jgi:hypothetical protein